MASRRIPLALASVVVVATAGVALWLRGAGHAEGGTVAGLVRRLKEGAATGRSEAATALGQVVGPGAADAARGLVAALDDGDAEIRSPGLPRAWEPRSAANRPEHPRRRGDPRPDGGPRRPGPGRPRPRPGRLRPGARARPAPGRSTAWLDASPRRRPQRRLIAAESALADLADPRCRRPPPPRSMLLDDEDEALRRSARSSPTRYRGATCSSGWPTATAVLGATIRLRHPLGPRGRDDRPRPLARPLAGGPRPADGNPGQRRRPLGPHGRRGGPGEGACSPRTAWALVARLRSATDDPRTSRVRAARRRRARPPADGSGAVRGDRRAQGRADGLRRGRGSDLHRLGRSNPTRAAALGPPGRGPPRPESDGRAASALAPGRGRPRVSRPPAPRSTPSPAPLADRDPSVRPPPPRPCPSFLAPAASGATDALRRALRDDDRGVSAAARVALQGLSTGPLQSR